MPVKYYIYAGGRWCEVDTRRGRVAGFRQRARFCFYRGGKLEVGRSAAVLRALRALAVGAGGAARDSAPLLGRRPHRSRRESARANRCCSQHLHDSRCDLNANELSEKVPSATGRKRKRSPSEESHRPKQARTESQTSPLKTKRGKRQEIQCLLSSSEDNVIDKEQKSPQKKNTGVIIERDKEEETLVQSLLQSSSEDGKELPKQSSQKAKPGLRVRGEKGKVQVVQSSSEDDKELPKRSSQKAKPGPRVRGQEGKVQVVQSSSEDNKQRKSPQKKPGPRVRGKEKMQRSSDSEKSPKTKSPQKKVVKGKEEKLVQSLLESSSEDNEEVPSKTGPKPAKRSKRSTDTESSSSNSSGQRPRCKELVIDDSDVRVLRGFLARGAGGEELERFDNDEEYKTRVFYKLHPLVILKRCGPLEQLLTQRLSLQEFARHLGLRSVADVTPVKRYRMSHGTGRVRDAASVTSDSESEKEKENAVQPKRRQLWNRDKELFNSFRSSRSSELRVKPQIHRPQDTGDSDTEVKQHTKKNLESASAKMNPKREEKETRTKEHKEDSDSSMVDGSSTNKTSSDTDDNQRKSRHRTRGRKYSGKSSNTDEKRISIESSSSESDSKSDENTSGNHMRRKTRSQGPEKRVLREHNKSVVVSDDSDESNENRSNSRTKELATAKAQSKSDVVSDDSNSSTDENEKTRRTRSKGPNRALKEQNRTTDKMSKESDKKANKNDPVETKKIIISPSKAADDSKSLKAEATKNDQKQTTNKTENALKSKENKAGPSNRQAKETSKNQDKSVISDSEEDFDTPKISRKKNKLDSAKQSSTAIKPSNIKRRFFKTKDVKESHTNEKISEKETQKGKGGVNDREKESTNKDDKNRSGNEDREKRKVRERECENKDNKENSKIDDKGKENDKKAAVTRSMLIKPVRFKRSSVANGREYTSLEDHAIVAWVSLGNREQRVNGNAVWRELERDYQRLTSQTRTWHSLRNRYLRYILPALGALALPPAQVSRLRSAAAVGSLKARNVAARRNSIFNAPRVRSAAAAGRIRLRPVYGSDTDTRERTPTPPRRVARKPSPAKPPATPAKPPAATAKPPLSPAKATSTPVKATSTPLTPRSARLRARSSVAASPTPKKKRIHHL